MSQFYSLREAMFLTEFAVARAVYQSSWEADNFAEFVRLFPITDGSASKTYNRRKTGDKISAEWITPGQATTTSPDPKFVECVCRLRSMVKQAKVPSHLRHNYNNVQKDPLVTRVFQILKDVARDIWGTAIVGIYVDTCSIVPGGGITTANLLGANVISPGPYNDPQRGQGALSFKFATKELSYRAPGDNDFGDPIVIAVGTAVTLRSAHVAGYITFTPGALPGSDGTCLLEFTSSKKEPDGLTSLIDPSMVMVNKTPTAITFGLLDEMITKLNPAYRDNPLTAFVFHSRQINALLDRARGFGGAKIEDKPFGNDEVGIPEFTGMAPKMIPTYRGHPLLTNDRIPDVVTGNARTCHDGFLVCLDPTAMEDAETDMGGFGGIVRGAPEGSVLADTYGLGFFVQDLGALQGETNDAMRITFEGAWVLGSSGAAVRTTNLFDPF